MSSVGFKGLDHLLWWLNSCLHGGNVSWLGIFVLDFTFRHLHLGDLDLRGAIAFTLVWRPIVGDFAKRVVEMALHENFVWIHFRMRLILLFKLLKVVLADALFVSGVTHVVNVVLLHRGA